MASGSVKNGEGVYNIYMAITEGYRDYMLEQLEAAGFSDVKCRPMMGGVFIICGLCAGWGDL